MKIKKIYLPLLILSIIVFSSFFPKLSCDPLNDYCIYFKKSHFFDPVMYLLIPTFILSSLSLLFKNASKKNFFLIILIPVLLEIPLIFNTKAECSGIVCFNRAESAFWMSVLFSSVCFLILLVLNIKAVKNH